MKTKRFAATPRFASRIDRICPPDWQLSILLVVALLFGGGGVAEGGLNLIVEGAALAWLALNRAACVRFVKTAPRPLIWLVILSVLLPALQLVPLPPLLWSLLPGRDVELKSLGLAGFRDTWLPLSMDPNRTAIALAAVIACIPFVVLGSSVNHRRSDQGMVTLAAVGLFSLGLGALQLASANRILVIQPQGAMAHQLYATFANHNSSGLFFVIALIAVASIRRRTVSRWVERLLGAQKSVGDAKVRTWGRGLRLMLGTIFAVCVVLTQSRSSMGLLFLALVWIAVWHRRALSGGFRLRNGKANAKTSANRWPLYAIAAIGTAMVLLFSIGSVTISQSFNRFSDTKDPRPMIWDDAKDAAMHYFPVGAGIGSFSEVFQLDESLEYVAPARAGRAHNELLEVAIESGVPGIALVLGWVTWIAVTVIRRRHEPDYRVTLGAASIITWLVMQSFVDFPLRNLALLTTAAAMTGILGRQGQAALVHVQSRSGGSAK